MADELSELMGGNSVGDTGMVPVVNQRIIVWDEHGNPVPATRPLLRKEKLTDIAQAALSLPYIPVKDEDKEFEGMTNAEVMMIRLARRAAGGDLSAAESLLDRINGRPKTTAEIASMNMTYEDFLDMQAKKQDNIIKAEVINSDNTNTDINKTRNKNV